MNENQMREEFRRVVLEKTEEAFQVYLDDSSIKNNLISYRDDIVYKIAEEQTDLAFDDFLQQEDEVSENEKNDQIREYVNEEFDRDFFIVKIEEKINFDQIREEYTDDLLLLLTNTEPYSVVPREYWYTKARRVDHVDELAKYNSLDGLETFVEKYAPDWEEVAKENQD